MVETGDASIGRPKILDDYGRKKLVMDTLFISTWHRPGEGRNRLQWHILWTGQGRCADTGCLETGRGTRNGIPRVPGTSLAISHGSLMTTARCLRAATVGLDKRCEECLQPVSVPHPGVVAAACERWYLKTCSCACQWKPEVADGGPKFTAYQPRTDVKCQRSSAARSYWENLGSECGGSLPCG